MSRAVTLIVIALVAVLIAISLVFVFQRQLIYLPSGEVGVVPSGAETVSFATSDGLMLEGWFFPGVGGDGTTAIVFNGNAGNRAGRVPLARELGEFGFNVLLFDYRGYGSNPGRPTEEGLTADGQAAIGYAIGRPDVDPNRLAYFGESLGTGVAAAAALEREPALLILRSPYTSLPDVASGVPLVGWMSGLLWDEVPTIDRIGGVGAPVLVVAGTLDGTIPIDQSQRVFGAANEPKVIHEVVADHNDAALAWGFLDSLEVKAFIEASLD